jgi:hypothetical protein
LVINRRRLAVVEEFREGSFLDYVAEIQVGFGADEVVERDGNRLGC